MLLQLLARLFGFDVLLDVPWLQEFLHLSCSAFAKHATPLMAQSLWAPRSSYGHGYARLAGAQNAVYSAV